jgi:hypothetical protein
MHLKPACPETVANLRSVRCDDYKGHSLHRLVGNLQSPSVISTNHCVYCAPIKPSSCTCYLRHETIFSTYRRRHSIGNDFALSSGPTPNESTPAHVMETSKPHRISHHTIDLNCATDHISRVFVKKINKTTIAICFPNLRAG